MPTERMLKLCETAAAEGCVLLKNDSAVLPLKAGTCISVFGRIQLDYYKSGTGSGGLVNVESETGILDALLKSTDVTVNRELLSAYQEWVREHPFDIGVGWATEPWAQQEMPLSDELVRKAEEQSDTALIIIGRTAGEDRDHTAGEGSYFLTREEENMLEAVTSRFQKTVVLLNAGNVIDMSWMKKYEVSAVLYVWQGGMQGGVGACDVLTGKVTPSGKLTDTIAADIKAFPSFAGFGDLRRDVYTEDIYVGYRYFETFAPEQVMFPFGFGLSYTSFSLDTKSVSYDGEAFEFLVNVTNTGKYAGKEVVQVYVEAPQGTLGRPVRELAAFGKTGLLAPGEAETVSLSVPLRRIAAYDDTGTSGFPHSYVLEAGGYVFYVGSDVKNCTEIPRETYREVFRELFQAPNDRPVCVEKLSQRMAPVEEFWRLKPQEAEAAFYRESYEIVSGAEPKENRDLPQTYISERKEPLTLRGVAEGSGTLEDLIGQLTPDELTEIVCGEGMCSPKVTPGTASAFGGVTQALINREIPAACCADGPSGIRMDYGATASSIPIGTCLACTWNENLLEDLFEELGKELVANRIDILLGPGMNIHRIPLNGRNFEYFSEDPLLTGKMAAAELRGLHREGVTGTVKHFACNNQETSRTQLNVVVSERAIREIYLKGFQIAVEEGDADAVMTSYNAVNGIWSAGNYDLNTAILRDEWNFNGIVMTDWWAQMNDRGSAPDVNNLKAMVSAQNDLYMVMEDVKAGAGRMALFGDFDAGRITLGELQRSAYNICSFLLKTKAMRRLLDGGNEECTAGDDFADGDFEIIKIGPHQEIALDHVEIKRGTKVILPAFVEKEGEYGIFLKVRYDAAETAQLPCTVSFGHNSAVFTIRGTLGEWKVMERKLFLPAGRGILKLNFGGTGARIEKIELRL